jgi:DNA-binding transcriptional MerR regulator
MRKKTFSTSEVARIAQLNINRLNNWLNTGLITPSIEKGSGYGSKHVFSLVDIYKIFLFIELINSGFAREAASKILESAFNRNFDKTIPLLPEWDIDSLIRPWLVIYRPILNGDQHINSFLCSQRDYGDGSAEDPRTKLAYEFVAEINHLFTLGSPFLIIFNLSKIVAEVNQKIEQL